MICAVGLFFLWTKVFWKTFACSVAGSYECVETWTFKVSQSELLEIIHQIKKEHPELEVPNYCCSIERQHKYWYYVVFYYKDTNQDVHTWIRPNDDILSTTFALVSIAAHNNANAPAGSSNYEVREINKDYEYFENRKAIKKFEEKIIKLIEERINKL